MAVLNIDFSQVEAASAREPIPSGWQRGIMEESDIKPTSNGATTGNTLCATKIKIIDGPYANQVLYKNFNYKNTNQQAQDIGWGEMKALNDALGIAQPLDTNEWHNKPFLFYIKLKAARIVKDPNGGPDKEYDAQNDVTGFKNINDTTVQVNHNVVKQSGGQPVMQSGIPGGSPVPAVGVQANPALAATPAFLQQAAAPATVAPATPAPIPTVPAVTPPPPAPVAAPVMELRPTLKANGASLDQFRVNPAWTDALLVSEGYAEWVEVAPPASLAPPAPVAPTPPTPPAAPQTPATPASTAPATGAAVPPWLAGK